MTGMGAHAAASIGVMKELERRGIVPGAVCALQWGAWPAALFAAGCGAQEMEKALHQAAGMGGRMLAPCLRERLCPPPRRMASGVRLNRLLNTQTGGRVLSLCPGAALFPCRLARSGQRVVFSTRAFHQEADAMLAMQASVSFAARAALAMPPFLAPLSMMGSPLLGETDAGFAVRALLRLGMHRVLVVAPVSSPRRAPDALDLAGASLRLACAPPAGEGVGVLRVIMPDAAGALSFARMDDCCQAGALAAVRELDALFEGMGMAFCRVLPFRRQTM